MQYVRSHDVRCMEKDANAFFHSYVLNVWHVAQFGFHQPNKILFLKTFGFPTTDVYSWKIAHSAEGAKN